MESHQNLIRRGTVKSPNFPSVCGIGYLGQGQWKTKTKEYKAWSDMIRRCYSEKFQKMNPTYKGCTVDERWHSFQSFCEDVQKLENYNIWLNNEGWELDKDIKIQGNKLYSKDTCIFIKRKENMREMNQRTMNDKLTGLVYVGTSPTGKEYEFTNQTEFARLHGLHSGHVNNCLCGRQKTHKKWTFKTKKEND